MHDHVHMMIAIPPKYAVSQVVGFIKGKNAIHVAKVYASAGGISWSALLGQALLCLHSWSRRGNDPGLHQQQEQEEERLEQLNLWR